jgi:hypothetical protein
MGETYHALKFFMKNGKVEKKLSMFRGSRSDTTRQAGITIKKKK